MIMYFVADEERMRMRGCNQGRQTRQNSGGGGCRFGKGGVAKNFAFLRDKNMNFLEVLR